MRQKCRRPDEYYNNGALELVRSGEAVSMRNLLSPEDQRIHMKRLSADYEKKKEEIDRKVVCIREKVSRCDPLQLLIFSTSMGLLTEIGKTSESDFSMDEIQTGRATEYLQSVLVSSENHFSSDNKHREDPSDKFHDIMDDVHELSSMVDYFYWYWAAYVQEKRPDLDDELMKFIVEAQMSYLIRGNRYQVHEIEHLEELLAPHDQVLAKLFDVSAGELVDGLRKLQYSLSQGYADALNDLWKAFQDYRDATAKGIAWRPSIDRQIGDKVFGTSLHNVALVTGWNEKLVQVLSFGLNTYHEFYTDSDFSGWPIIDLAIQKRPFIRIGGVSYCFDYYDLFDNIYRVLQKTICRLEPEYGDQWASVQQVTSETMAEDLFKKLLPGCTAYKNNYYPMDESSKEYAENDILVTYDKVLLIVEVKAGSFTYTPPITDYEAHIKSLRALVECADHQCERTRRYIVGRDEAPIYDGQKNLKAILTKSTIDQIFTLSVTIDDFNVFAAKADKLSFLHLKSNAISISVNDLRTYSDYFISPLQFLHFLKQRQVATATPKLALNDELDHLGMYIKYNAYSAQAGEFDPGTSVQWNGYRKELDSYFGSLYHPELKEDKENKPEQEIPARIREIIRFLEGSAIPDRVFLSNFLLDLPFDRREQFSSQIDELLTRQKEIGRMLALYAPTPFRYCVFVRQPGVRPMSERERSDYVYSIILYNQEPDRLRIDLRYDQNDKLEKLEFILCLSTEIRQEQRAELYRQARTNAVGRTKRYLRETGKKEIGRNEPCPCGSGKKYKKCCGRSSRRQ